MKNPKSKKSQISLKQFVAKMRTEETRLEAEVFELEYTISRLEDLGINDPAVQEILLHATKSLEERHNDLESVTEALSTLIRWYGGDR